MRILHITPHMGGGVGNVISKISVDSEYNIQHKVILLEEPVDYKYIEKLINKNIEFKICPDRDILNKCIYEADIVIIHWWHHPLTSKFIYNFPKIPSRIILWSHISNLTVPCLNSLYINYVNKVFFTTPASYEAYHIDKRVLKNKTDVIYGCGGLEDFPKVIHERHKGFNIGYLGLIDFSKLNRNFIDYCKAVNIEDAKFILAGECTIQDILEKEKNDKQINNDFLYLGYIRNIIKVFSTFDVFGYPLMEHHTCTTENAILEAMASECVPILINQLSEKYIVNDGKTGFLVSGPQQYGEVIRYLYRNPDKRKEIGLNARNYVLTKYNSNNIQKKLNYNFLEVLKEPKRYFDFKPIIGKSPEEWFLSGLGQDKNIVEQIMDRKSKSLNFSPLLKQKNKASVFQYQRAFPYSKKLRHIADLINKELIISNSRKR